MKVLVIGSGGREHALAWKLAQSPKLTQLYIAPGNPGTAQVGQNVDIKVSDITGLVKFAKSNRIDFTVVGPDDALAAGVVDAFRAVGLRIFGPPKAAARIEWSKAFAKEFMSSHGIPTAKFKTFNDYEAAKTYLTDQPMPIVIKASGLALGKGVTICQSQEEAQVALRKAMVDKVFGEAGSEVVIEEYLSGQETSIHALCDGKSSLLFPVSQDHKSIFDGDEGPNTGGMGTYAPVLWADKKWLAEAKLTIVDPVIANLPDFVGCLYPGLIGDPPKVVEFNARFGDPETQVYVRLLRSDLLDLLEACVDHRLSEAKLEWHKGFAVCVVLASGGYPGIYPKGLEITGVEEAEKDPGVVVFQAGTTMDQGKLLTVGGRVLNVTATGTTLQDAVDRAYSAAAKIQFEGMYYRKDIGAKALLPKKA